MSWLFGAVFALVVIVVVIAIVQKLVKMALIAALLGFGGLAVYYVFMATAPPTVKAAVHQASEEAVKVGAQVGAGAVQVGKKAVQAGAKAADATSDALDKIQKEPSGSNPPAGGKKP